MQKTTLEITWDSIWRVVIALIIVAALFAASNVVIVVLLSLVIAAALNSSVTWLEQRRIPRAISTLLIFVVFMTLLASLLYIITPLALLELKQLLKSLSALSVPLIDAAQAQGIFEQLSQNLGNFIGAIFESGTSLLGAASYIFGNIFAVIMTIVLSFYFTINRSGVEQFIKAVLPIDKEGFALELYGRVKRKMGLWLRGQLLLMLAVATLTYIGLTILGAPYALILSLITGLLGIVPMVGPILAGALAFLVTVPTSITLGILVAALFVVIQQIEANLIVPYVMRRSIGLSPAVVIVAILLGNQFAGISGVILAIPLAMVFQEWMILLEKDKALRSVNIKAGRLIE